MNIEAIAVDIDGTITDNKRRLCCSAMEAIRKAEDAGIPTIIVTGNIITYAYATSVLIGASGGAIGENGGVIFKENYNNNQIKTIVDRSYVTAADNYLKETLGSKFDKNISNDNMYRLTESVFYKTITKQELEDGLKDFKYLDKIELYDSEFALHITDKRINKGNSLEYLCMEHDINMKNVMAIGDSENDVEFLSKVGVKIAVGNAKNTLKEISDYTCENSYGDGVYEAINKFVL